MKPVRCAIYTRKSSEDGLEQDFNSLHAQREACAAYVLSQASESWTLLPDEYDDGGLSAVRSSGQHSSACLPMLQPARSTSLSSKSSTA